MEPKDSNIIEIVNLERAMTMSSFYDKLEGLYHRASKSELDNIVENFNAGRYFGVPMLQYMGMSAEPHNAEKLNLPAFPEMKKWVLE
jgi:hypothetical protein